MVRTRIPVVYGNWGIGNRFLARQGEYILLHKKLQEPRWKDLHDKILAHEEDHATGPYCMKDWINDLKQTDMDLDIILFLAETPSAWVQFSPIWIYGKKIVFDRQGLFTYSFIAIAALLAWTLL